MSVPGIMETTQYLTFKLDEEQYALDISRVREVLDLIRITKVPRTPEYMRGVINLRGGVVPIMDMRSKFGLSDAKQTRDTCIIIFEVTIDDEQTLLGAMADSVQEVLELQANQIEPPPKIGTRLNTEFIKGMGKHNDDFIIILNIDKVFSTDELVFVQEEAETLTKSNEEICV